MKNDTPSLKRTFTDISNYLYANDGVMKDRAFADIVRLIAIKISGEVDSQFNLLNRGLLDSLDELEIDSWSRQLIDYAIQKNVEESNNVTWNIKDSSLLWAAKKLSTFRLSELTSDVKGEAFQALVVNNLRGDRGEFFTPPPVVSAIVNSTVLREDSKIIDPACGTGGFLYGSFLKGVDPGNLYGIEVSHDIANAARTRLGLLGARADQILQGDAFQLADKVSGHFDLVLMNPPFGSRSKIQDIEILSKFELSTSTNPNCEARPVAPEVLFLELGLNLLKPGGVLGTVIPDGLLQNSSYKLVREWVSRHSQLLGVISCPAVTFQPYGTGVKTSILILKKKQTSERNRVYFAVSKSVGYDARGVQKLKNEKSDHSAGTKYIESEIDEDLSEISNELRSIMGSAGSNNLLFGKLVDLPVEAERWDAEFYDPKYTEWILTLKNNGNPVLGDVVTLVNRRIDRANISSEVSYIALSDLDARISQIVNIQYLSPSDLPSRAVHLLEGGEVITAISGASTGTSKHVSALVPSEFAGAIASSGFAVLKPEKISPYSLLGFLRSSLFLDQIRKLRTGHAIPAVNHKALLSIYVPDLRDPMWKKWHAAMKELDERASDLVNFAENTRNLT